MKRETKKVSHPQEEGTNSPGPAKTRYKKEPKKQQNQLQ